MTEFMINVPNAPLAKLQLQDLIDTMKVVLGTKDAKLDMGDWVHDYDVNENGHFCNTVACICGHQALSNKYDNFKEITDTDIDKGFKRHKLEMIAVEISNSLDDTLGENIGNSVYCAMKGYRSEGFFADASTPDMLPSDFPPVFNHLFVDTTGREGIVNAMNYMNWLKNHIQ